MPKRPRTHEIEDKSRRRLHDIFGDRGWVVWDLYPDYGEDLLVRIFVGNVATHYSFFVQAKGTDNINNYLDADKRNLSYPINIEHAKHWKEFWEPVFLTVWDSQSDITYWTIIQDFMQDKEVLKTGKKTMYVRIPLSQTLDDYGLQEVLKRTKQRHKRFEVLSSGVSNLIKLVELNSDLKVEYNFDEELLTVDSGDGFVDFAVFGEFAELLENLSRFAEKDPEVFFYQALMNGLYFRDKNMNFDIGKNGRVTIRYFDPSLFHTESKIVDQYDSLEDFKTYGSSKYFTQKE